MMFDKKSSRQAPPPKEEAPVTAKPAPSAPPAAPAGQSAKIAMIGEGISITGDVAANSNLKVEGRIEGHAVSSSHDVEVAETGAQDGRRNFNRVAAGQLRGEITRLAVERFHRSAGTHVDQFVVLGALDHAADGVFRPLARGHQLGIALEDWCTAQAVFLVNQNALLAECCQ